MFMTPRARRTIGQQQVAISLWERSWLTISPMSSQRSKRVIYESDDDENAPIDRYQNLHSQKKRIICESDDEADDGVIADHRQRAHVVNSKQIYVAGGGARASRRNITDSCSDNDWDPNAHRKMIDAARSSEKSMPLVTKSCLYEDPDAQKGQMRRSQRTAAVTARTRLSTISEDANCKQGGTIDSLQLLSTVSKEQQKREQRTRKEILAAEEEDADSDVEEEEDDESEYDDDSDGNFDKSQTEESPDEKGRARSSSASSASGKSDSAARVNVATRLVPFRHVMRHGFDGSNTRGSRQCRSPPTRTRGPRQSGRTTSPACAGTRRRSEHLQWQRDTPRARTDLTGARAASAAAPR